MSEESVLIGFSTFGSVEDATRVVRLLVEEGLAACGTLLPGATSIYQWEGKVQEEPEVQVLLKTHAGKVDSLRSRLVELHPYDTPEFFAMPVSHLHSPYAEWLVRSLK